MKHILITGGANGIGKAIVEELAGDYRITATYHNSKQAADEMAAKYPNVRYVPADLEDRNSIRKLVKELAAEPIDVLINNAGLVLSKSFIKTTEAELLQQVDLNFSAVAQLTHGLLPALRKAKAPLVVNISSQAAHGKLTGEAMYSATKAAVSTLSYVLRAELNPENIRITAVEPYGVNTYGIPEPSNILLPKDFAKTIRTILELPDHVQVDTFCVSHIKQARPSYPEWVER